MKTTAFMIVAVMAYVGWLTVDILRDVKKDITLSKQVWYCSDITTELKYLPVEEDNTRVTLGTQLIAECSEYKRIQK
jgi:ribosomal protein RSM22 (predicted rRNA methylase)